MELQDHFHQIETQGFSIVPGLCTPAEVAELTAQLQVAMRDDMEEYGGLPGKVENLCLCLLTRGPAFVRLLENERMHAFFTHFLSDTCILYSMTSTILEPGERPGACEIHVDSPRLIPGYHTGLLMTLALDDFTEENGATYYLPGSHTLAERPSEETFARDAVRVVREAGDAVFFNPRVWHAGGANGTGATRHGLTIYACRSFMRQRLDYPRMVGEDVLRQLGERGRSFLGFDVRVPANLREFYVPPERRLYKAGQG